MCLLVWYRVKTTMANLGNTTIATVLVIRAGDETVLTGNDEHFVSAMAYRHVQPGKRRPLKKLHR